MGRAIDNRKGYLLYCLRPVTRQPISAEPQRYGNHSGSSLTLGENRGTGGGSLLLAYSDYLVIPTDCKFWNIAQCVSEV